MNIDKQPGERDLRTKEQKQMAFLEMLTEHVSVTAACKEAGLNRSFVYGWLNTDPQFVALYEQAHKIAIKKLADEAVRRAYKGVKKNIFYKGFKIDEQIEYSDTLMQFLLKAHDPETYGKDRTEISGPNGGPIETKDVTIIEL